MILLKILILNSTFHIYEFTSAHDFFLHLFIPILRPVFELSFSLVRPHFLRIECLYDIFSESYISTNNIRITLTVEMLSWLVFDCYFFHSPYVI